MKAPMKALIKKSNFLSTHTFSLPALMLFLFLGPMGACSKKNAESVQNTEAKNINEASSVASKNEPNKNEKDKAKDPDCDEKIKQKAKAELEKIKKQEEFSLTKPTDEGCTLKKEKNDAKDVL